MILGSDSEDVGTYEKLTLAFKAMGGGLWEYDLDVDQIWCNRRWYEILGIDENLVSIRTIRDFRPYIHREDVERATHVDLDLVSQWIADDGIYHVDFRIVRPNGEIRWLRSVACLTVDSASKHRVATGCITDVTDWRLSESLPPSQPAERPLYEEVERQDQASGSANAVPKLTQREKECLMWVSLGKTANETGRIMGSSPRTVEFHLNNSVRKLGAVNKMHAAARAIRAGLI